VSDTIAAASFNDGKDAGASTFDDLITFNGKPKRAFNGQCNNSVANGCAVGIVSNPTGNATCGTVRTWTCLGTNGGTDDTSCSFTNPACLPCTQTSLTWGSGCSGPITPTPTAHGSTTSTVTNTNPSYTGTAAASCNNGVLTTTTSTCTPAPTPGVCNNAVAGGCSSGVTANDNGLTACGTTRTWHCNSTNGGTNATNCSKANAACSSCSSTSLTWGGGCVAVFPNTGHAATTPVVTNTNASYTGSATALCTDGTFATPSGPCAPVVPENGVCDNATAGACVAGDVADNIQIVPALRAVVATDLTEAATFSENGDLDATYVKAEVTGLYHLDSMQWLQGSLSRTVAGTQAGNGYGLSFGYARRF
jgi:hypothetical protein